MAFSIEPLFGNVHPLSFVLRWDAIAELPETLHVSPATLKGREMLATICPSLEELQRLLDHSPIGPELERIENHVAACSQCLEQIKFLSQKDHLSELLAGLAIEAPRAESAAEMDQLIDKIEKFTDTLCNENTSSDSFARNLFADDDTISGAGDAPENEVDLDFLGPPQQADELGRLGGYRILQVLGKGGMGAVFLAEDSRLHRRVAIKVMLPKIAANATARDRFLREARAAARLNNDHVVTIHQVDEANGVPYLAMELLEGQPLDRLLHDGQALDVSQILRIGQEVARGLAAAHEMRLIHRDIKPGNIWLDSSNAGRAKILDFGLARGEKEDVNLTQSGTIVGTPAYMAPEQGRGKKSVDARADLFSLGCVLYRLCTGDTPFRGEDTFGILTALAVDQPTPPRDRNPSIPQPLSEFIMQLLEKVPANRPQSAKAVITRLQEIEKELANKAEQTQTLVAAKVQTAVLSQPVPPRVRSNARRGLLLACGLALCAAAILAAGVVFFLPTSNGTIRVQIDDDAIEVALTKTGARIKTADKQGDIIVEPGEHSLKISRDGLELETDKFVLKRGETVTVEVRFLKGELVAMKADGIPLGAKTATPTPIAVIPVPPPPALAKAWTPTPQQKAVLDALALLHANTRQIRVKEMLRDLDDAENFGHLHKSKCDLEPQEGPANSCVVAGFLSEIWPLTALPSITALDLSETSTIDFQPLVRLPLVELKLNLVLDNLASEQALKSIPTLKTINGQPAAAFWETRARLREEIDQWAAGAAALQLPDRLAWFNQTMKVIHPGYIGAKTTLTLNKATGQVRLQGSDREVTDLTPVRGLKIAELIWSDSKIFDLSPLAGTQITHCTLTSPGGTRDLSPLARLPLKQLHLHGCLVGDLTPLANLPLEEFSCNGYTPRNQGKLGFLTDITPLAKLPLKKLALTFAEITDLRPLAGLKLTELRCTGTRVTDIAPLKNQPLEVLEIGFAGAGNRGWMGLPVGDLQPLTGMPLKEFRGQVRLYFDPEEKLLKSLPLQKINGLAPEAFWKKRAEQRMIDQKFVDSAAKLAPEKTIEAVREEILKRAPLYNGNAGQYMVKLKDAKIQDGFVAEATVTTHWGADHHHPFVPLRAFPKLRKLTFTMADPRDAGLREVDFSPLVSLPIEELTCSAQLVTYNLPVLRAMPKLTVINGKSAKEVLGMVQERTARGNTGEGGGGHIAQHFAQK